MTEPRTAYTITLPLPPAALSPNHHPASRGGRMGKSAATQQYRRRSSLETMLTTTNYRPRWQSATVQIRWLHPTRRWPDRDNIISWLKSAIDGLTDAGLIADDRDLNYAPVKRDKDAANPRVEITITQGGPE